MNKNIGILGYGEVGSSLCALYKLRGVVPVVKDEFDVVEFQKLDVLDICIPYTDNFVSIVKTEIINSNPSLVVIHSTIPIGTTKKLDAELFFEYSIVHSPIRGNHPNLTESLQTFVKYIGSNNPKASRLATNHFLELGLSFEVADSSEASEAAKLLCTTYYGLCIAWHNEIKKVCDKFNVSLDFIKNWNGTYNEGYESLGLKKFNRPILDPPQNKKIGGHCVVPNAELLDLAVESSLIKEIIKYK